MRQGPRQSRSAYTMIEVMAVAAIIVIAAAISIPIIQTTLEEARISASGDLVRGKLAETRARAMEEGRPYRFGFIAHTGFYQIAPEDADDWSSPSQDLKDQPGLTRDQLPVELIFALSHQDIFGSDGAGSGSGNWEAGVTYLPDGTARDDAIFYFGKPGRGPMRANLRGLTGNVNIETYRAVPGQQP